MPHLDYLRLGKSNEVHQAINRKLIKQRIQKSYGGSRV